jgi:RNA polymerase sigma-70 factor (ECF subfamily)
MTPIETPSPDPDALGRDLGAVRRLARGLVAGDDLADDVVQETVIVALRRGGDRSRSAAAWLAGIARNVARNLLRAGRRRARHEAAAHPARPAPSVLEDAARIEEHRRVLAAARDLTEPYRSVVILRFFDDLTPTAIAALTGRAVPTVKTQLRRALAHMRRRLDTESEGKRDRWVRGLLPLLPLPGVASTTVATGTAAVAAAALALAFFLPARDASRREDGEVPAPQATVLSSAARLASRSIGREEGAGADREGPDGPRSEIDIRVDASGVGGRLPAHVFLRGRALARVALPLAGAGVARATSLAPGSYAAWVEADGVTASAATFSIPYLYDYPPVLHLSSAVGLTVKVVDAVRASPVAGARVEVVEAREGRGSPAWSAVTDSDGLARLSAVPVSSERSPRFRVAAFARGFEAAERVVCLQADASRPNEVVVALSAGSVVVGSARTARAEPVPDALVVALPSVDGLDPEILWRRLRAYSDDLELIGEEGSAALPSYLDGSSGESTGRIVPLLAVRRARTIHVDGSPSRVRVHPARSRGRVPEDLGGDGPVRGPRSASGHRDFRGLRSSGDRGARSRRSPARRAHGVRCDSRLETGARPAPL